MKTISMSFEEYTEERQHLECEARKRGYASAFSLFERMLKNGHIYTPLENNCK